MRASEFFKPGNKYIYIGEAHHYFTNGKTYKYFYSKIEKDGFSWAVIETDHVIDLYKNDPLVKSNKANGFGDGFFRGDIRNYFKLVNERKNHLPKWF